MKKALLMLACLLLFAGCSSAAKAEDWPEKVEVEGVVTITKLEEKPQPFTRMLSYVDFTIDDVMKKANLIMMTTIPEPVYYEIDYGPSLNSYVFGYKVIAEKVFYSDKGVKEGDTVRFIRSMQQDEIWVTLEPGNAYVLFLQRNDSLGPEKDYRAAIMKVAEYCCVGPYECIQEYSQTMDECIEDLVKQYK